ncbi:MAG TPA: SRPBCC family protein [Anaerolineales bacterium]|nr:SRPBCC family protein [Anaerolineales bacterium]
MGKFILRVFINRSQQDVFDFLSNPVNLSKWNSNFASAAWTSSEAPGPGSTYKVLSKMSGGKNEGLFEITQWDPPHRYGYKSISRLPFPIESIESTITLAPKEHGTQITFESQFGLVGVLKLADGMFRKLAEKGDGHNFDTAKRLLEANEPANR